MNDTNALVPVVKSYYEQWEMPSSKRPRGRRIEAVDRYVFGWRVASELISVDDFVSGGEKFDRPFTMIGFNKADNDHI